MNIRTRQTVLIVSVLALGGVAAAYYGWRWFGPNASRDHWRRMSERAVEWDQANGGGHPIPNKPTEADLAAPAFHETPGPAATAVETHFIWTDAEGRQGLLQSIEGCLPAGSGTDIVWHGDSLYLAREPGKLRRVWSGDGAGEFTWYDDRARGWSYVCFDGKYVWAPLARPGKPPRLIVLDPRTEESWEFTEPDGSVPTLPPFTVNIHREPRFAIAPVAPGKVCAVNTAEPPWVGILQFAAPNQRTAETIPISDQLDLTPRPAEMFALEAQTDAGKRTIAVYGRAGKLTQLLIDPEARTIRPATGNSSWDGIREGQYCIHAGALWWIKSLDGNNKRVGLARAALPDLEEKVVVLDPPTGILSSTDGRLHLWGRRTWRLIGSGPSAEVLELDSPWSYANVYRVLPDEDQTAASNHSISAIFQTQHDGLLALAYPPYAPRNGRLFRVSIGGPTSEGLAKPVEHEPLAAAWPVSSVLSVSKLASADDGAALPLAVLTAGDERAQVGRRVRLPLLGRELARQAVLLAARDQLRWRASDGGLGESTDPGAEVIARWRLGMRFGTDGRAAFALLKPSADDSEENGEQAEPLWQESLQLEEGSDAVLDYRRLAEAAERWSREVFPRFLEESGMPAGHASADGKVAALPEDLAADIERMSFPTQYVALRRVDALLRASGESEELLAALVRGYAHLGLLTRFHWTCAPEIFQARSLLIAQRFAAKSPRSPLALWCRAYAEAFVGLHQAALDDLASAGKLAQELSEAGTAPARPEWVELVDAFCRFDGARLEQIANGPKLAELGMLLSFLQFENMTLSVAVQQAAVKLLQANPECYLIYDSMCDCCAIGLLHGVTANAPAALREHLPQRVASASDLPPIVLAVLEEPEEQNDDPHLIALLAEALSSVPPGEDGSALSWSGLGSLVRETHFLQWWRRGSFMRFQWSVPTGEFVESIAPLVADHRYHALIQLLSAADGEQVGANAARDRARDELLDRLNLGELKGRQWIAFSRALGETWQAARPDQWLAAAARPALHRDDLCGDLLDRLVDEPQNTSAIARRILKLSPFSPDAARIMLYEDLDRAIADAPKIEREHAGHPTLFLALSEIYAIRQNLPEAQRLLREYIKFSPDLHVYRTLADYYKSEKQFDRWRETLDEFLQQESNGLEHAQVRVELANHFMDRYEWSAALPYAEQAAETWAEWAMLAAIRCYQGLGDDENEGLWRARVAERYPSLDHSLNYYLWARRAGRSEAAEVAEQLMPQLKAAAVSLPAPYRLGAFYSVSGQPREALAAYQAGAADRDDARSATFCACWAALAAQQAGDEKTRAAALAQVAAVRDPALKHFSQIARWLQARIAAQDRPPHDLSTADESIAAAPAVDRAGVNYVVGRYLQLAGHKEEATKYLQAAATVPEAAESMSRELACAALRDLGIVPNKINWPKPKP